MPARVTCASQVLLSIGIGDFGERSAGKKRATNKADGPFNLAFGFCAVRTSALRCNP